MRNFLGKPLSQIQKYLTVEVNILRELGEKLEAELYENILEAMSIITVESGANPDEECFFESRNLPRVITQDYMAKENETWSKDVEEYVDVLLITSIETFTTPQNGFVRVFKIKETSEYGILAYLPTVEGRESHSEKWLVKVRKATEKVDDNL